MDRADLSAGVRFEQHLPGDVHQEESQGRFRPFELLQGLLGGLLGGILTRSAAADQQVGVRSIPDGSVHTETAIRFHADRGPDDQLISLLHTERVQARQMAQGREGPLPGRVAK